MMSAACSVSIRVYPKIVNFDNILKGNRKLTSYYNNLRTDKIASTSHGHFNALSVEKQSREIFSRAFLYSIQQLYTRASQPT